MECPMEKRETVALLLDYCAGRSGTGDAAVLEAHVGACPVCREFVRGQREVWAALDTWEAAPVPEDFDRRLQRRIAESEGSGWWRRLAHSWGPAALRPAVPLAAACLALLAVLLLGPPGAPDASLDSRAEMMDATQAEGTLEDLEMLRQFSPEPQPETPAAEPI